VPAEPEPGEPNRDLPPEIMAQLCAHLDLLTSPQMRTAVELAIDTGRGVRIACPHPLLLGDHDCGGLHTDRQAPRGAIGLVVVVDQHGESVVVAGQAVEGQRADLFGTAIDRSARLAALTWSVVGPRARLNELPTQHT